MRTRTPILLMTVFVFGLSWGLPLSRGQENSSQGPGKQKSAYRLDFSLNELDDGKKLNTRQYSLSLIPSDVNGALNQLKIGTRVPVELKQGEMEYLDIGTSIYARMIDKGDFFQLEVTADLSNFASPQPDKGTAAPLIRQLRINANTIIIPGKTTSLGSVEDPNSKRQFQLDVVATKLSKI
jgi:hypothetical protein